MPLDADVVVARRRLKRRLTFWRAAAVVAVVAAVVLGLGRFGLLSRDYVARVTVDGLIVDDLQRNDRLIAVAEDDAAKALIVRIDSPGGTVVGGESLYRHLRAVGQRKPVVAVLGEVATSAAYMTALGADRIIARAGTVTGSIGVVLQTADVTGLLDKLGVQAELIKSDPLKAQPNPLEELTPRAREVMERVVMDMQAMFVEMVQERRNFTSQQAAVVSDGRVFTGRQAVDNGLIDATGSDRDAHVWLKQAHGIDAALPVRDIDTEDALVDVSDWLLQRLGKAVWLETLKLDGLVSLWHPDL